LDEAVCLLARRSHHLPQLALIRVVERVIELRAQ
jgi:hypothetical protein